MYEVQFEDQTIACDTRAEAVTAAKSFSAERWNEVVVASDDGLEQMIYRRGELERYWYETRRGERRR